MPQAKINEHSESELRLICKAWYQQRKLEHESQKWNHVLNILGLRTDPRQRILADIGLNSFKGEG